MPNILVLDDNTELRSIMVFALQRAGHQVFEAGDGKEGIRLLQCAPVDVLVTDVVMPNQDGLETIILARKLRPSLRIVVISGDSPKLAPLYLKIAGQLGAHKTLLKPFTVSDLMAAIQEAAPPPVPPTPA